MQKTYEKGADLVEQTGEMFQKISEAISRISAQIDDVTCGTERNRVETGRIAVVIEQTAAIAMNSANHTENIAAASDALAKRAQELQETIRRFKL